MVYGTRSRSKFDSPPAVAKGSSEKKGMSSDADGSSEKKGMSLEQRLTERAKRVNGYASWYVSSTEAMETLLEVMKSPTDRKTNENEDAEFLIRYLYTRDSLSVRSMDEVRGVIYLIDNYGWRGKARIKEQEGYMDMVNVLAEHGIRTKLFPSNCDLEWDD